MLFNRKKNTLFDDDFFDESFDEFEEGCGSKSEGCGSRSEGCGSKKNCKEGCASKKEGCGSKSEGCGSKKEGCSSKSEGCGSKKNCNEMDDEMGMDDMGDLEEGCGKKRSCKESFDIDDEEFEESLLDDSAYEVFSAVNEGDCENGQCEIDYEKSYEDIKKDAFAFGATSSPVDNDIDSELGNIDDIVPDNVNILGSGIDDFEYDDSRKEDMDNDDEIEIVIDDEDIYDSEDI